MPYEVMVTFTEDHIRTATRRFFLKTLGWDYFVAWVLLLAVFVILIAEGDRSWFVGVLGAMLVGSALVAVAFWLVYRRRGMAILRRMKNPTVHYVFDEDGVLVRSDLSEGRTKWSAFRELWRFPEVWLLFLVRGVYATLPTEALSDEIGRMIVEKMNAQGSRIV